MSSAPRRRGDDESLTLREVLYICAAVFCVLAGVLAVQYALCYSAYFVISRRRLAAGFAATRVRARRGKSRRRRGYHDGSSGGDIPPQEHG